STSLAADEFVLGYFPINLTNLSGNPNSFCIVVTNKGVYSSGFFSQSGSAVVPASLSILHIWSTEINATYLCPGNAVTFIEINGIVYFSGLMLNGIYFADGTSTFPPTYAVATNYVCCAYLAELDGRMVAVQCRFPGGGGPLGNVVQPAVAWSGV